MADRPEAAADAVRRWSDELARDPAGRAFLPLGDALRRQGELDLALRVALRGVERHPGDAEALDLLGRVAVDRGEYDRAGGAWAAAVAADPTHAPARRGLGFLHYRAGRLAEAEAEFQTAAPTDHEAARGLARVRRELAGVARRTAAAPQAGDARALFAPLLGEDGEAALLLDADGLVIAGAFHDAEGRDVAEAIGAQLTGVSDDATRAMRHLDLGGWTALSIETERAVVTLAPAPHDSVLLVAARADAPLGSVRRLVERVTAAAARWLAPA